MSVVRNPLLDWVTDKSNLAKYDDSADLDVASKASDEERLASINRLIDALNEFGHNLASETMAGLYVHNASIPRCIATLPPTWARSYISCSLLSNENIAEIVAFSGGNLYERGGGSGYNAWLFQQAGCDVLCTDYDDNWYNIRFTDVRSECSDSEIKKIANAGGALIYVWPKTDYHGLDKWVELGGKKIIVVGDHQPDLIVGTGLICPVFPLPWKLVKTSVPPMYSFGIEDVIEFYESIFVLLYHSTPMSYLF